MKFGPLRWMGSAAIISPAVNQFNNADEQSKRPFGGQHEDDPQVSLSSDTATGYEVKREAMILQVEAQLTELDAENRSGLNWRE